MKAIKINRFTNKKPEEISFTGSPILDNPLKSEETPKINEEQPMQTFISPNERTSERTNVRTETKKDIKVNERTNERSDEKIDTDNSAYAITIPQNRRKIRHSFDIFEDQKNTLEKLQLAIAGKTNNKKPSLGDLIQEAIDLFAKQKSKELKNISIKKESE